MKYKEFGIYVNDYYVAIIINNDVGRISGFELPINYFNELSNKEINNWMLNNYKNLKSMHLFEFNPNHQYEYFKTDGYLGLVDDNALRDKLVNYYEYLTY